jgi:hypothetical protein
LDPQNVCDRHDWRHAETVHLGLPYLNGYFDTFQEVQQKQLVDGARRRRYVSSQTSRGLVAWAWSRSRCVTRADGLSINTQLYAEMERSRRELSIMVLRVRNFLFFMEKINIEISP